MTLMKDLITIPEQVLKGDFVLKISEVVEDLSKTQQALKDYVVTPQLVKCFERSLELIKAGSDDRSSKATYLHGSFGSGKSHFMAVLYLLLQGDSNARSIPELAQVVAKYDGWMQDKKFLMVPYHMIGAASFESAVLGHYVEFVSRLHPDAPRPGVYLSEPIFKDADIHRKRMGDDSFFAALDKGQGGGDGGWGDIGQAWDAATYDLARDAAPRDERRARLVGDLVDTFFENSYGKMGASAGEGFVNIDEGLSILTQHAKSLGYDGLILFLDELVLWLASHAADTAFLTREAPKISKLVESQTGDRPIPLISFVARQRDLRELIGDHMPGAEKLNFIDQLKFWEGRFSTITLEDRNLPAIAEKRVLKPQSEAARLEIDAAFAETLKARKEVRETLLTKDADDKMFRKVYPFSPALTQTLVAVSSVLQRERTALKVMVQLLVNQRETLELGDLVPVGDLFDVIVEGDEPFSEEMRLIFEDAKKLYFQKLVPMLEQQHDIRYDDLEDSADDPKARAFNNDARLLKTLILSALVPEVEALRSMDAQRLAALNHGTIKAPIPGHEGQMVLNKVRNWASQVGAIKVGEEPTNPTITLQISGVEVEGIISKAAAVDNTGNRKLKLKELLYQQLGIKDKDDLFVEHDFTWRGTQRTADVVFGNVRELPAASLQQKGDGWKVVIDFPFDEPGHSPSDDLAKIENFRQTEGDTRTLCWVPNFFNERGLSDLGRLVMLDHILAGERFDQFAAHLSSTDRAQAHTILESQASALRQRMLATLGAAYGVFTDQAGLDMSHELSECFQSLDAAFTPQRPTGADLNQAFERILDQMLSHQYPAHPKFDVDIKSGRLKKVQDELQRAAQQPDGRIVVPKELRSEMRCIAEPLKIGEMHEDAFILGQHWFDHFNKKAAQEDGDISVGAMRRWMDEPDPTGLHRPVQNLVILTYADRTNRTFTQHGGPAAASIDAIADDCVLRDAVLPTEEEWTTARDHAHKIFGLTSSKLLNAANVAHLVEDLQTQVTQYRDAAAKLATGLTTPLTDLGLTPNDTQRLRSARAVHLLLEALASAPKDQCIPNLAQADIATTAEAMATSMKKAAATIATIDNIEWLLFEKLKALGGDKQAAADTILDRVRDAFEKDELAVALQPAINGAAQDAIKLITEDTVIEPRIVKPKPGRGIVTEGSKNDLDRAAAQSVLDDITDALEQGEDRRLTINYKIDAPTDS